MSDAVVVTRFARGVKLTTEHVYSPLQSAQTQAASASFQQTQEPRGATRASWVIPWADGNCVEAGGPVAVWPFPMPPFQQDFTRSTLPDPNYPITLSELSVSFDLRAEALGLTDDHPRVGGEVGCFTDADLTRYAITLRLFERQPSMLSGVTTGGPEVLNIMFPGEVIAGANLGSGQITQTNPFVVSDLQTPISPFSVYYWQVECPGLFTATLTEECLALVSLNLSAVFVSNLTIRDKTSDFTAPGIQNIPTKHNGNKAGTTISVVVQPADGIISGDDIQTSLGNFDVVARRRAKHGYGGDYGGLGNAMLAADRYPSELLRNDAHYAMIVVPMWHGQRRNAILASDVAAVGLPYTVAPWTSPAYDRRVIPLPDNFTVHHVFAVWNNYAPQSSGGGAHASGARSTQATYVQKVGVALNSGMRADDYKHQQVAYLEWTGANFATWCVDDFSPSGASKPNYCLMHVPLVNDAALWDAHSWFQSGRPFFMGRANNSTSTRSNTGTMPTAFGGVAFGAPNTAGRETCLEIAWSKADTVNGLNDPGNPNDVRVGQGGEWVILVGKQTLAA